MSEKKYTLTLTKEQLKVLSYACDQFSRLICGQDWSYQNLMEEAWEKRDFLLSGADFDAGGKSFAEHVSAQAVGFADALIERLKGKEGKE